MSIPRKQAEQLLGDVFGEDRPQRKPVIRGRSSGIRRPTRSTKAGFLGRGYKGSGGRMQGQWQSGELKAKDLPQASSQPEQTKIITEFESVEDWVMSVVLVAFMHANPEASPAEAIEKAQAMMRSLHLPREAHRWKRQLTRVKRLGIRAEASKIRRELFKLI